MELVNIDRIKIKKRLRSLDKSRVNDLAESIHLIGLLNPITVIFEIGKVEQDCNKRYPQQTIMKMAGDII